MRQELWHAFQSQIKYTRLKDPGLVPTGERATRFRLAGMIALDRMHLSLDCMYVFLTTGNLNGDESRGTEKRRSKLQG
jgi:hypothetical protein